MKFYEIFATLRKIRWTKIEFVFQNKHHVIKNWQEQIFVSQSLQTEKFRPTNSTWVNYLSMSRTQREKCFPCPVTKKNNLSLQSWQLWEKSNVSWRLLENSASYWHFSTCSFVHWVSWVLLSVFLEAKQLARFSLQTKFCRILSLGWWSVSWPPFWCRALQPQLP